MKRWMIALSLTAALCISAAATYAGPACCKSKKADKATAKVTTVVAGESCSPKATCKSGAFPAIERKFVVAGEVYDSESDAWAGLADASEKYVERFATIACVVDGKVVYCDEKDAEQCAKSGSVAKASLAGGKSGCCGSASSKTCSPNSVAARLASVIRTCGKSQGDEATKAALISVVSKTEKEEKEEPECCKAKLDCCEKAKAEGKKGNCCAGEDKVAKAKLASAKSTCSSTKTACDKTKLASAKSGSCKSSDGAAKTKLASDSSDDKACCKAKLASAEGGDKACCKAKLASAKSTCSSTKTACDKTKLASAKSGCCKSKDGAAKTKLASDSSDDKACCKAKLASADGGDKACCKAKLASAKSTCSSTKTACDKTKLASAKSGCCKSKDGAAKTKLASAKSACSSTKTACDKTKLASAKSGCCKSKDGAAKTKLASAEGCCKSKATQTKLVEGKACCDAEGITYRVAGRDFSKWDDAVVARDAARSAIKTVGMSYLVNGEKVDCSTKVCPKAKAAGKVKFVVGETTTGCELHARVELAKAQVEAVSQALAGEKVATR